MHTNAVTSESAKASDATRDEDRRPMGTIMGWGRLGVAGRETFSEDLAKVTRGANLSRGLGRSYGDSSLPAEATDRVVNTVLANRVLSLDEEAMVIRVEAGASLVELNKLLIPRGLFSAVTPGTKFVTVGGMVASDVHGKNHHREGCFGEHVRSMKIRLADDSIVECSPTVMPDLFYGTIGGMGLLGHILEVEFELRRIPSQWIWMESERVDDIDSFVTALNTAAPKFPMTMGWIDCLNRGKRMGRGILMAGRWATESEAKRDAPFELPHVTVPIELPNLALNAFTAQAFNSAYYWRHLSRTKLGLVGPETFFYPLDAMLEWNKVYGPRGFTQYQCVIPRHAGPPAVRAFMELLTRLGGASPLCVIKDCGPEGRGTLSFPLEGTSIAVDMAVSPDIQRIVDQLNEFVIETGGRIYLTKDRFTTAAHFRRMEPRLDRFVALRDKYDPRRRIRSAQSVRLLGD
jgi:decaprenylphospho-beta-D-ribofuranose 2-oxidase